MKILADPGVILGHHVVDCTGHQHLFLGQDGDPVAYGVEAVEVVRDHEHGQPQRRLQIFDQFVERRRPDRIEPGGGLVQEHDLRVERERPRQPRPLAHAARQFRGELRPRLRRQAHKPDLHRRDLVHQLLRQMQMLLQRDLNVLGDGEGREQRAVLEEDTPAPLDRALLGLRHVAARLAEDLDASFARPVEPEDGPKKHRLARARSADDAQDLAAVDVEVEMVVNDLPPELVAQVPHGDDDLALSHMPSFTNRMENNASSTMTVKMPSTTEAVVR